MQRTGCGCEERIELLCPDAEEEGDDRTYFIDRLREALLRKMDTDDEKQYRWNK